MGKMSFEEIVMKRRGAFIILLLAMIGVFFSVSNAEEMSMYDDLPEGLYIYSPIQGKVLPWVETEDETCYQIIGLAPHDCTVSMKLSSEGQLVWTAEMISEGNGYFSASIPSTLMSQSIDYLLEVTCLTYKTTVEFTAYSGTLTDYAVDPTRLEQLGDLTEEEEEYYSRELSNLKYYLENEDETNSVERYEQGPIQTGLNEFNNGEYSYRVEDDGTVTLLYYYGHQSRLVLPATVDGYHVSGIDFSVFNNAPSVITVTIPSSITQIKRNPFQWWRNLTAIYVPQDHTEVAGVNGVLYAKDLRTLIAVPSKFPEKDFIVPEGTGRLGSVAFTTSTIRKITFPETLRSLGGSCFSFSFHLREATLPDGIRVLEEGCFRDCGIQKLLIPSKAAVVGSICEGCERLEEIVVMPGNETVKSIDGVLFSADGETLITYPANKADTEYVIPFGTVHITESAFKCAKKLEKVEITEGVRSAGERAFYSSGLRSVKIPDSLIQMGNGMLDDCENLLEIIVASDNPVYEADDNKYLYSRDHDAFYCYPAGLDEQKYVLDERTKEIKSAAFSSVKLSKVFLPEGLEQIEEDAFWNSKLTEIYIPGTVKSIGSEALANCEKLGKVAIGEGVKELGRYAFRGSRNLKSVTIPETVTSIGEMAFLDTGEATIYTNEGSFASEYAKNNQLKMDTRAGEYEKATQEIKDNMKTGGGVKSTSAEVVVTNKESVNIRESADAGSRRIGNAQPGESFKWLETVQKGKSTWYKIELNDGSIGYISSKMTKLME